jgi:hypothetical protein
MHFNLSLNGRVNSILRYLESYSSAPSVQRVPKHEASEGPLLVGIQEQERTFA